MDANYALSDQEVEDGYILSCQAHPASSEVTVDFDFWDKLLINILLWI